MQIKDFDVMEGYWRDYNYQPVPDIESVRGEPITDDERRLLDRMGANNAVDLDSWHSCIGFLIAVRVRDSELYRLELEYQPLDFGEPVELVIRKTYARRVAEFMLSDFRQYPHKVEEAWSWLRLGAELPDLAKYYEMVHAALPSLDDLGQRIEDARRRLL